MKKVRVYTDIDSTILESYSCFLNYIGKPEWYEKTTVFNIDLVFGDGYLAKFHEFIKFNHDLIQPSTGAIEELHFLKSNYELKIVTARNDDEIFQFSENYPDFGHLVCKKEDVKEKSDFLIDDYPKGNIAQFSRKIILIDRPWNKAISGIWKRVKNFKDAVDLINSLN